MLNRQWMLMIAVLVSFQVGCYNRCQSPGGCGPFANSRIPSPGTGRLLIPSRSASQPYYVPGGSPALAQTLNPNQAAPTLAANPQQLNGWTQVPQGGNPSLAMGQPPLYNQIPQYNAPPTMSGTPGYRVATATTLPDRSASASLQDSGSNGTMNQGSRIDPSRLPASDATQVRAPSQIATNPAFLPPAQQPRYTADLRNVQTVMPPQFAGNQTLAQPNFQGQSAPPFYGAAPSYQSPFIRSNPQMAQSQGAQIGWSPRSNDRGEQR